MDKTEIANYEFPEELQGLPVCGDLESNGLYHDKLDVVEKKLVVAPAATRIWMTCYKIPKAGGVCYDFIHDRILKRRRRALERHNRQYGRTNVHLLPMSLLPKFCEHMGIQTFHNGMKFDFPLIEKLTGYHLPREKRWDTLVQSQTQNCDRDYVNGSTSGPHSLESWAIRINKGMKVGHEDWMNFSVDMYKRCWRDVEIQCDVLIALEDEREADMIECNINWDAALLTEHRCAYWMAWSEQWGFPLDEEYARGLIVMWDKHLAAIEDDLLPDMPFRMTFDHCGTKKNWEEYSETMLKNTNLTRLPLGWCWHEELANKPLPMWNPFLKNGDYSSYCLDYWNGKDAQPFIEAQDAIVAVPSVKEKGKVVIPGIRAKKAQDAIEAKPRKESCYEDDAGLTEPPIHRCKVEDVAGPYTRIQWSNYSLGSNAQVLEYLKLYTPWVPTEYTDKGNPKLTEDSFDSIGTDGTGEKLKDYLITKSRRTNVLNFKDPSKGWLNLVRKDGRVTPVNHSMGTPTARSRHSGIVNVPSGGAKWGTEMRTCWTAYEGGMMIGSDASGLEMRCLAHEMGDPECTSEIVDGDIHTVIWELIPDFSDSRGNTKSIEYCLIYGGADPKLGALANVPGCREKFASLDKMKERGWVETKDGMWRHKRWNPKKESLTFKDAQNAVMGSIIRARIMKGLKPLGDCIERVTRQAEKGFLVGVDGRKLIVRSTHSALNLKLQSTGAILMKTATANLMDRLEREGLVRTGKDWEPNKYVELFTFYHDEVQFGVPSESITDTKVINFDISEFDLSEKKQKKAAKEKIKKIVGRWHKRQRRTTGKIWSQPHVDMKAGTATVVFSLVGQYCVEEFEDMGREFKLDCPITGDWMYGKNWLDTH